MMHANHTREPVAPVGSKADRQGATAIGRQLRELRLAQGLSLRQAARKLDISYSALREYEQGHAQTTGRLAIPKRSVILRAAELYSYPVDVLLTQAGLPTEVTPSQSGALEVAEIFRRLPTDHQRMILELARFCARIAGI